MSELTHFSDQGHVHMVDIGAKPISQRTAVASGEILMHPETLTMIRQGEHAKGDVLGVARLAGIMAAKQTSQLIPLCHPLSLTAVTIEFTVIKAENEASSLPAIRATATVRTDGKTGVEMEALTAVNISLLTIYDMTKAVDKGMVLSNIRLDSKKGGQSGDWSRPERSPATQ